MIGVPSIYLSSGAFNSNALTEILAEAADRDVVNIELSSGIAHHASNIDQMRLRSGEFDFLIHNYFPAPELPFVLNLASADRSMLEASRNHCLNAMELTAEIKAPFYSVHAGFLSQPHVSELGRKIRSRNTISRNQGLEIFSESVQILLDGAEALGVMLLLENNVVAPFNLGEDQEHIFLLADPNEILEFLDQFGGDYLGLLLDVAHLNVSAHTLEFDRDEAVSKVLPKIVGFHLSDNDGTADTNDSFDGSAWFLPWLAKSGASHCVVEAYDLTKPEMIQCVASIEMQFNRY